MGYGDIAYWSIGVWKRDIYAETTDEREGGNGSQLTPHTNFLTKSRGARPPRLGFARIAHIATPQPREDMSRLRITSHHFTLASHSLHTRFASLHIPFTEMVHTSHHFTALHIRFTSLHFSYVVSEGATYPHEAVGGGMNEKV